MKLGLAVTLKGNRIVRARSFPANPYDGHTMQEQIEQSKILMRSLDVKSEVVYATWVNREWRRDNPCIKTNRWARKCA